MADIAIITDSSACLPRSLIEESGIIVVAHSVIIDGETHRDGALTSREFYLRLAAAKRPATTAAPAPGEFLEEFRRASMSGAKGVLCLTLSSRYSSTFDVASAASQICEQEGTGARIRVVDTGGLAMTHGFAVLAAARAAGDGASIDEAVAIAQGVASQAHLIGVVETTRYLAMSGRVPWVAHWATALLRIKPMLEMRAGKAGGAGRVRTVRAGIEKMIAYAGERSAASSALRAAVMHADAPGRAGELAEEVRRRFSPMELIVTEFTSVMGVHTGPGFVGLAFYSDEKAKA